jgi:hypothetical protein
MPASKSNKTPKSKKKQFSTFNKAEAFQSLGLMELTPWALPATPVDLSDFFQERLQRLTRHFDLESYEESKKLLIDAICDEAMEPLERLKIWKGAQLEGETAAGYVDYLVAERRRYLTAPMLCIIEAKKDDFEQGLAQCLVEMQACQWRNRQENQPIDVLGIVTNGTSWQFYRLSTSNEVFESAAYSTGDMTLLLGRLRHVFRLCEENLK